MISDAPILQNTRNAVSEWTDSNNMIVDQSKVIFCRLIYFKKKVEHCFAIKELYFILQLHASLANSRSPLLEKQSPNFNCDGNHNINNNNSNNAISKVNSGNVIEPAQTINNSNNLDANQKYGFIMGIDQSY